MEIPQKSTGMKAHYLFNKTRNMLNNIKQSSVLFVTNLVKNAGMITLICSFHIKHLRSAFK